MNVVAPRTVRGGRWIVTPNSAEAAALRIAVQRLHRRRSRLLALFVGAAIASGILAVSMGGEAVAVNLVADGGLIIYIGFLIETTRRHRERDARLVPIARRRPARDRGLLEPIRAGGGRR